MHRTPASLGYAFGVDASKTTPIATGGPDSRQMCRASVSVTGAVRSARQQQLSLVVYCVKFLRRQMRQYLTRLGTMGASLWLSKLILVIVNRLSSR